MPAIAQRAEPSSAPVAMISYRTWRQQYGSDPSVVGSTFILDKRDLFRARPVPTALRHRVSRSVR
jgi:hypothetical protein